LKEQVYKSLVNVRLLANNVKDYVIVHFIETQMLEERTIALEYMSDLAERIERSSDNLTIFLQITDQYLRKKNK
jgi:hypothetical protein